VAKEEKKHTRLDDWFTFHVAPYGIAGVCLALGRTWKKAIIGESSLRDIRAGGKSPIFAFWHERLFSLANMWRRENIHYLSSESRDGEISAKANDFLGFTVVRGSASHSGLKAMRQLIKHSSAGFDIALTPDGPRGPRRVAKDGIVYLGMKTGLPIIPITSAASSKWVLKSWDRFQVPKPFSRVLIVLGPPIYLNAGMTKAERTEARERIEKQMVKQIETADRIVADPPRGLFDANRSRPRPWSTGKPGIFLDGK
jgi:lysophospholipid acyltransferase (LPLAT)-like uncharacterized protein